MTIEDVNLAPPSEGEVHVKLSACAICHSDITYMDGGWGGVLPAVYGHEAAGKVISSGPDVEGFDTGDAVVVTLVRHCGECRDCTADREPLCQTQFALDKSSPLSSAAGDPLQQGLRTGAFAEEVVVHHSQLCKIPDDFPLDCASLLSCGVLTGAGAVLKTVKVPSGASVIVIGAGGVGLNSIQGAAISGAEPIIAVDVVDSKLKAAEIFGASHTVNSTSEDLAGRIADLTGGEGADYVFVTVGAKSAIDQGAALLARGGTAVIVGMPPSGIMAEYDIENLTTYAQRIIGSKMGSARISEDIPRFIELYREGRLKLEELISARYTLEEINEAIATVKQGNALRNVIVF